MRFLFALTLIIIASSVSTAQVKRTIHQTFELSDENVEVSLDIYDEYEVEEWSSNNIMVVITATLESGAQHLLDFYVEKKGRYDIEKSDEGNITTLVSKDKERRKMKYRDQVVYEIVTMKMYIPENYEMAGKDKLVKKKTDETVSKGQ